MADIDLRLPSVRSSTDRLDLGDGMAVVWTDEPAPRFEHRCRTLHYTEGDRQVVCAPALANHTVSGPHDAVTVRASVLCPDCGLHGFVTDGRWSSA